MILKAKICPKSTFFFLICLFACISCKQENKVDVSNIKVDLKIKRFDQDLAKVNPNQLATALPQLQKEYGAFYQDYFEKILNTGPTSDTTYYPVVKDILSGAPYQDLQKETQAVYPNLDAQIPKLTDAFKHVKYYYPEIKIPTLITYISGFQVQTPIGENYIGIGLDMFLGSNSKFYPALVESIPMYISKRFTPDNITPRVMEVLAREELFPESDAEKSLLDKMIYNGKILYFLSKVQPHVADSVLIGYTKAQAEWASNFESDIWAYFLSEDLLYDTDYLKIQKYLSEAPFTPGLGDKNNSAPKLGLFIGWQIVKHYMQENPETTLQNLMLEKDYQKILKDSKYRPNQK
ncbi:gliding motility lipoprotein GldB [Pedobacter puniceum]|jgi:gliding motility-associated lipoprotein GldB|uniref:Gliding motility lipoprotein GldB n=1 Tax=Pedobacter puniceum TaxID=2666136 RepID=A0A7K0FPU6_9SPHI|nr:gliding motility lipoprotein GldB [Pedobacter puniceum]MRX47077.1 gliding motility lipoprotein GldB [Pedobacter puniceum]